MFDSFLSYQMNRIWNCEHNNYPCPLPVTSLNPSFAMLKLTYGKARKHSPGPFSRRNWKHSRSNRIHCLAWVANAGSHLQNRRWPAEPPVFTAYRWAGALIGLPVQSQTALVYGCKAAAGNHADPTLSCRRSFSGCRDLRNPADSSLDFSSLSGNTATYSPAVSADGWSRCGENHHDRVVHQGTDCQRRHAAMSHRLSRRLVQSVERWAGGKVQPEFLCSDQPDPEGKASFSGSSICHSLGGYPGQKWWI